MEHFHNDKVVDLPVAQILAWFFVERIKSGYLQANVAHKDDTLFSWTEEHIVDFVSAKQYGCDVEKQAAHIVWKDKEEEVGTQKVVGY